MKISVIVISVLVMGLVSAQAEIIYSTDLEAVAGASQSDVDAPITMGGTVGAGISVSQLSDAGTSGTFVLRADGVNDGGSTQPHYDQGLYAAYQPGAGEVTDLAAAIAGNSYFEFTLNCAAPQAITNFSMALVQFGYANASGRNTGASLFSSLTSDFGGTVSAGEALATLSTGIRTAQTVLHDSFDLSGVSELQNVSSVTFRIYQWEGYTGTAGNRRAGIDDISISGYTVPEPGTLGLVGAFGTAILFIRRKFMIYM